MPWLVRYPDRVPVLVIARSSADSTACGDSGGFSR